MSKYTVFSGPNFAAFRPNRRKYGPATTPYWILFTLSSCYLTAANGYFSLLLVTSVKAMHQFLGLCNFLLYFRWTLVFLRMCIVISLQAEQKLVINNISKMFFHCFHARIYFKFTNNLRNNSFLKMICFIQTVKLNETGWMFSSRVWKQKPSS